jgi:hypothetical protein
MAGALAIEDIQIFDFLNDCWQDVNLADVLIDKGQNREVRFQIINEHIP